MKENDKLDWFAGYMLNPELDYIDFQVMGHDASNTFIQTADKYKSNEKVQEIFKDDKGAFDEKKFDNYYKTALATYNEFVTGNKSKQNLRAYSGTYFNSDAKVKKAPTMSISQITNPMDESYGIIGFDKSSKKSNLSMAEIAQTQLVWDPLIINT